MYINIILLIMSSFIGEFIWGWNHSWIEL